MDDVPGWATTTIVVLTVLLFVDEAVASVLLALLVIVAGIFALTVFLDKTQTIRVERKPRQPKPTVNKPAVPGDKSPGAPKESYVVKPTSDRLLEQKSNVRHPEKYAEIKPEDWDWLWH